MTTTQEDYMRRLANIQNMGGVSVLSINTKKEPRFVINADTRVITIPAAFKFLGVKGDHNAETIFFEIDRYFDDHDLSEETCIVQYKMVGPTGIELGEGFFPVTQIDITTIPGKIIFGWTIRNTVTAEAATVSFSVRFYSIENVGNISTFKYNFNTLEASLPVLDTLNTSNSSPIYKAEEVESLTAKFDSAVRSAESSANISSQYADIAATNATNAIDAAKAAVQIKKDLENGNFQPSTSGSLTPEQYGAVGDGVADDTEALVAAMTAASEKKQPLELKSTATYRFTERLELKDNLTIHGNGAVLLSDIQCGTSASDRPAILSCGRSNTDQMQHIRLDGITLRAVDTCETNYMLRFMRTRDVQVRNCIFDCDINTMNRGCLDVYGACNDFVFDGNIFRQLSACKEGGIWVRSWTSAVESSNIRFLHCDFYKAGGDEVLAVWGWNGVLEDVLISGCNFYDVDDEKYRTRGFYPAWGITLGQSGKRCDVRMENCVVRMNRCETLFRMLGNGTHAVVDNCDIYSDQPDDMKEHDSSKGANPILARGNDRNDGTTLFSNCRIHLRGDNGRRICYQVSALRNNYFDVKCGYGPSSTKEVIGNLFHGSLYGLFWDCDIVRNNMVELTNAGSAWMSGAGEVVDNQIKMDITADAQGGAIFHNNWNKGSIRDNKLDLTFAQECDVRQYDMHGGPQYVQNNIITIKGARYTHLENALTGLIYRKNNFFNNVPEKLFECTGVTFDEETRTEQYKKHTRLGVTISPEACTDPVVYTWDNADGVLDAGEYGAYRPLKDGTANVTVSCGMFSASQKITVKLIPVPCEGLKLSRVTAKCGKGMNTYLKAFPQPYWTTDDVIWSSDAEDVVTVTQDGVVSALKTGTANITVTCGSFTVTCAVTVVEASELPTYTEGEWALDNTVAYIPMPNLEAEHTLYAAFDVDMNCVDAGEEIPIISSLLSGQTGQEAIKLAFGADGKNYKTIRWNTTDTTSDEKGNTTLYSVPYVNTGFKEDEPASTRFLYMTNGVANPSGAVIWASQTSTVKAAPNSGILSFNVQTSAEDTPITSFTSGASLAAALASGSAHATKATGFKLRELILYTNSSYTTLDEIKKYRENAEIDLRFDADGHPLNAGTAGDFVIADKTAGEVIPVSSVTLNKTALSLAKSGSATLMASVLPADATDKTVRWNVSPEGVVTLSGTTGSSITVTAAAAGECTITTTAGGQTITCSVNVTENANPFPAIEAAYVLPEAKTFTPAAAEYIDTGVKLFDVLDPKPTFTILFEADASKTLTEATLKQTLLNCAEDSDPLPGLELRIIGSDKVQLLVYTSGPTFFATSELKEKKRRGAIRMKSGVFSATRSTNSDVSNWGIVNGMNTPVTKNLVLGAHQKSDGTKDRFWDGTLYQCVVYKSALTDEQLKEWVLGTQEASTASVLGQ